MHLSIEANDHEPSIQQHSNYSIVDPCKPQPHSLTEEYSAPIIHARQGRKWRAP
jgi:hypothetical protein